MKTNDSYHWGNFEEFCAGTGGKDQIYLCYTISILCSIVATNFLNVVY